MTQWKYCPECTEELAADSHGHPTCLKGHFTKYPTPVSATLAFIRNGSDFLIVRRDHDPKSGSWDLPGGFVEPNETSYEAQLRETFEETGLTDLKFVSYIGTFPSNYGGVENTLATGYVLSSATRDIDLSDENSEYKWTPLSEIPELAFDDCNLALAYLKEHPELQ